MKRFLTAIVAVVGIFTTQKANANLVPQFYGSVGYSTDYLTLTTGSGAKSVGSIGTSLLNDKNYFNPYGVEGSAVVWSGLELGTYQLEWELISSDLMNDAFYFWNQEEVGLIANRSSANQFLLDRSGLFPVIKFSSGKATTTIDVVSGKLGLLALDTNNSWGTTDVRLYGLERVGDLPQIKSVVATTSEPSLLLGLVVMLVLSKPANKVRGRV
jgi:hypothetical protein